MPVNYARAAALAILAVVLVTPMLFGHTRLLRSDPADGETYHDVVRTIRLWFSTPVAGTRDGIEVIGPDGRRVDAGNARAGDDDAARFEVDVEAVRSGRYSVSWTVISADGHPVSGNVTFTLELAADAADTAAAYAPPDLTPPASDASESATPGAAAGAVGRWLHVGGIVLALGPVFFALLVAGTVGTAGTGVAGAAGSAIAQASPLRRRLWILSAFGALLLAPAALLLLGAQGTALTGSWSTALSGDALQPIFAGRWGLLWQIRVGLAVLLIWLAIDGVVRGERTDVRRPRLRLLAALATGALLIVATSMSGHAATTAPVALSVTADALHLAAAAVWLGGLFAIAFVLLPALRGVADDDQRAVLAAVVPRFSTVALTSVAVLVVTGVYQSWKLVGSAGNVVATAHGQVLAVKLGLFVLLLVPAAVNRFIMKPRLRAAAEGAPGPGAAAAAGSGDTAGGPVTRSGATGEARRFGRLVIAEAVIGVAVLGAAAVLTGLQPARGAADMAEFAGFHFEPPLEPPAIVLPTGSNGTFDLAAERGNAVLLFFGFTNCPDYCPLTLQEWRQVRTLLGEDAARTRFVFVSVDPERDTPDVAAAYARSFDETFVGLAPDSVELERIESGFFLRSMRQLPAAALDADVDGGVDHSAHAGHGPGPSPAARNEVSERSEGGGAASPATASAAAPYDVIHSTRFFLVDPSGGVRVMYAQGTAPELVAADIRRVLAERR